MKENIMHIKVNGTEYPLMVSLNVIAWAQKKYGSIEAWQELMSPHNEIAEKNIEILRQKLESAINEHGADSLQAEQLLSEIKNEEKSIPEADIEAICDSFTEIINEGIDYENEINSTNRAMLTVRQVGRIITAYGLQNASAMIKAATVASISSDEEEDETKNG